MDFLPASAADSALIIFWIFNRNHLTAMSAIPFRCTAFLIFVEDIMLRNHVFTEPPFPVFRYSRHLFHDFIPRIRFLPVAGNQLLLPHPGLIAFQFFILSRFRSQISANQFFISPADIRSRTVCVSWPVKIIQHGLSPISGICLKRNKIIGAFVNIHHIKRMPRSCPYKLGQEYRNNQISFFFFYP